MTKIKQEEGMNQRKYEEFLEAPCLLCGYNGEGYWQEKTHHKKCPWHKVGGAEEREKKLPRLINRALLKVYGV